MREQIGYPNQPLKRRASAVPATPRHASTVATSTDQPDISSDVVPEEDSFYVQRPHTSIRTYHTTQGQQVIERGNQRIIIHQGKPKRHIPWLTFVGIGMIVALLLVFAFNTIGNWWSMHQLDTTYGMPRTYQTDAVVYPSDSAEHPSHYIFLNLDGTVEIIEFPHGDSTHAKIYKGPTLLTDNADLIPVTGEFQQVHGHEEMLVHIGDQEIIYLNNGREFVSQQ